jgi:hypothetical protein
LIVAETELERTEEKYDHMRRLVIGKLTDTAFFRKYHTQALSQCLANVYSMYESFGKGHPEEHSICQDAARGV